MANIRIDADGLQNNISSMRAYINELDSLNARTQTLMTQIASSWEGEASTASVIGVKVPPELDKQWYIDLARKRLKQFGIAA